MLSCVIRSCSYEDPLFAGMVCFASRSETLESQSSASPKVPAGGGVEAVAMGAEEGKEDKAEGSGAVDEPSGSESSISARLALDNWMINIVEVRTQAVQPLDLAASTERALIGC